MMTSLLLPMLLVPLTAPTCDHAPCRAASETVVQAQPATPAYLGDGTVRMRKLHLVRPELIPYPLAYEVYC